MERVINYEDIDSNYILIDVRSPGEFNESHIPGAHNIPLFSDEERKIVGTIYKQESVEKAKKIGLQIVSSKLPQIYEEIEELCKTHKVIVIYCARGGMRSRAICSLLNSLGYKVFQLKGGYKEYRQYVIDNFEKINEKINYIILHGNTGVGKTLILNKLEQQGFDILDLEKIANHRGSCFGKVGLCGVISQKQFESLIFEKLINRKSNYVLIESESRRIGNVIVPKMISQSMQNGNHILIEGSIDIRAKRIVDEYTISEKACEELVEAIKSLNKLIGNDAVQELIELVNKKEYNDASKILMTTYYDKLYKNSQDKYKFDAIINSDDIENACEQIKIFLSKYIENPKLH